MTGSLKDYEEMFSRLSLTELEVSDGDFKLKLKKEPAAVQSPVMPSAAPAEAPAYEPEKTETESSRGFEVKAPLLGIFYGAADGEKAVSKGDRVSKGDILCTLEAMKMQNEVKAPVDGIVTEVLAKEGDLVEFDQVLFVIERA
ncbi:MAG: biotin/lipoyl-binding protein [Lachnospiraceae bacterium]|nr:biotin/lipoyl-binding protein [Lachnospiraceae bacterium]